MSFKELSIKSSYDSSIDNIINDFYLPILSQTKNYDRITGFFSSSSLAISSIGLSQIYENGGHVRLLISPRLSDEDVQIIKQALDKKQSILSNNINEDFNEELTSEILNDYRLLLSFLILKGTVEIKVVLGKKDNQYINSTEFEKTTLFHQKVGVLKDYEDNTLSFSGSINETFAAWNDNVEEFKTFKMWEPGQTDYCQSDINKFDSFWNGSRAGIEIIDLPQAVKDNLLEITKNEDFETIKTRVKQNERKKNIFEKLFWYQSEALEKWKSNNYRLLFAMATGTGKTLTALACIEHLLSTEENRLLVIISTPQSSLNTQWEKEIKRNEIKVEKLIICDSNTNYNDKLERYMFGLSQGLIKSMCIITTHATASSDRFISKINRSLNLEKIGTLFIGDEVHGLGSSKQRNALQNNYNYRIGLSATPSRWFDEEGSELLLNYFGNELYEFGIDKALMEINPLTNKSFLTPYYYYPKVAKLTDNEEAKYAELTERIRKLSIYDNENPDQIEKKKKLLEKRAEIVKNAENKLILLENLLNELYLNNKLKNTIIFVSPVLMNGTLELLNKLENVTYSKFTESTSAKPSVEYNGISQRDYILQQFKNGGLNVIVAIKCVDEGIDIPTADTAILVSSTTNPREYIQRIGRVIRRSGSKEYATVYDFAVIGNENNTTYTIVQNERRRQLYIVSLAKNAIEANKVIYSIGGGN